MKDLVSELVTTIKNWWLFLVIGILMFIGGIWVVRTPVASYVTLAWLFGVLVLADGIFYIVFSLSNIRRLTGWGWYLAAGILELLIGIYLLMNPVILLTILPFVVGFWLLFRGITLISSSLELKGHSIPGWGWVLTLGILLGIVGAYGIAMFMLNQNSEWESFGMTTQFSWGGFVSGSLLIIFVVILVSFLTIRYIANINIADVIRERAAG